MNIHYSPIREQDFNIIYLDNSDNKTEEDYFYFLMEQNS